MTYSRVFPSTFTEIQNLCVTHIARRGVTSLKSVDSENINWPNDQKMTDFPFFFYETKTGFYSNHLDLSYYNLAIKQSKYVNMIFI